MQTVFKLTAVFLSQTIVTSQMRIGNSLLVHISSGSLGHIDKSLWLIGSNVREKQGTLQFKNGYFYVRP